jgi:hypothetical protein
MLHYSPYLHVHFGRFLWTLLPLRDLATLVNAYLVTACIQFLITTYAHNALGYEIHQNSEFIFPIPTV